MLSPIQVPALIEHQGFEGSKAIAGVKTPVHPLMFLPTGNNEIIGLFDVSTADILLLTAARLIVRNERLTRLQIGDKFV